MAKSVRYTASLAYYDSDWGWTTGQASQGNGSEYGAGTMRQGVLYFPGLSALKGKIIRKAYMSFVLTAGASSGKVLGLHSSRISGINTGVAGTSYPNTLLQNMEGYGVGSYFDQGLSAEVCATIQSGAVNDTFVLFKGANASDYTKMTDASMLVEYDEPVSTFTQSSTSDYFGENFNITVNSADASYRHTVQFKYGSASVDIKTNVAPGTTAVNVPKDFIANVSDASAITGTIAVLTYSGSTYLGVATASHTFSVPASTASFPAESITLPSTVTTNTSETVTINRAHSKLTHKVEYQCGSSEWVTASGTAYGSCDISINTKTFLQYMSTVTSSPLNIRVTTYNGSAQCGSTAYLSPASTVIVPASYKPAFTSLLPYVKIVSKGSGAASILATDKNNIIALRTTVEIYVTYADNIDASSIENSGASISKYEIRRCNSDGSDISLIASNYTTGTIGPYGEMSSSYVVYYRARAYDTRGLYGQSPIVALTVKNLSDYGATNTSALSNITLTQNVALSNDMSASVSSIPVSWTGATGGVSVSAKIIVNSTEAALSSGNVTTISGKSLGNFFADAMPTQVSSPAYIDVISVCGEETILSSRKGLTVSIAGNSALPYSVISAVTGDNSSFSFLGTTIVQNKTKIKVSYSGIKFARGASVKSAYMNMDGATSLSLGTNTSGTIDMGTSSVYGNGRAPSITLTDSRGKVSTITSSFTYDVSQYFAPEFLKRLGKRCTSPSDTSDNDSGTTIKEALCVKYAPCAGKNALRVSAVRYKKSNSDAWTNNSTFTIIDGAIEAATISSWPTGDIIKIINSVVWGEVSADTSYDVEYDVTDSFGEEYSIKDYVSSSYYIYDAKYYEADGVAGFSLGKASEKPNTFECAMKAEFNSEVSGAGPFNININGGAATASSATVADRLTVTYLSANANLNDFVTVGTFACTTANAASIVNKPAGMENQGFSVEILENETILQRLTTIGGKAWVRYCQSVTQKTWSSWEDYSVSNIYDGQDMTIPRSLYLGGSLVAQGNWKTNMYGSTRVPVEVYGGNADGQGLAIGAGGATVIGSGESKDVIAGVIPATQETMAVASDQDIRFYSNCQNNAESAKMMRLEQNGNLTVPGGLWTNGEIHIPAPSASETHDLVFERPSGYNYEVRMDVLQNMFRIYTYDKNNTYSDPFLLDFTNKSFSFGGPGGFGGLLTAQAGALVKGGNLNVEGDVVIKKGNQLNGSIRQLTLFSGAFTTSSANVTLDSASSYRFLIIYAVVTGSTVASIIIPVNAITSSASYWCITQAGSTRVFSLQLSGANFIMGKGEGSGTIWYVGGFG